MLKNNIIIYDHECPLCAAYTGAFIKFELLEANGRQKYAEIEQLSCVTFIDRDRARNEIALVDTENQQVRYGLESLFYILGSKFPILKLLFCQQWFVWFVKRLYNFISYNRKVIAPSSLQNVKSCIPDFNVLYRAMYIVVVLFLVGIFALHFQVFMFFWAYWVCQVLISLILVDIIHFFTRKEKSIPVNMPTRLMISFEYLGHQITILAIVCLLLIPTFFFPDFMRYNVLIAGLIFAREFWRRIVKYISFVYRSTMTQTLTYYQV